MGITPVFEDIFAELDHTKIEEAILTDPDNPSGILGFEFAECKALVLAAGGKWLINDLRYILPESLEVENSFTSSLGPQKVKGIVDIAGVFSDTHWNPNYRGKKIIIDWKSAAGALDKTWENRHVGSWQWRAYVTVEKADLFSYRGISRQGQTREVVIEVPAFIPEPTTRQFTVVGGLINALVYANVEIWPQHKPSACGQYGTTCPFLEDCESDKAPRFVPFQEGEEVVLSYSSMERFLTCPEKYRRLTQIETRGLDGSESTRTGGAMHRGLAELYEQAFKKFGGQL